MIELNVNGQSYQLDISPDTPLLYVLRNDLGLKGPKYGCGEEQCGACKVLVDGAAVPSCQLPAGHVQGAEVVTVEGLGTIGNLHPLQEAFVVEQAIQCGYCAAGMVVAAQGLLNRTRYPTDDEIREALADNLCRCGVYDRVRRAIKLRIGQPDAAPKVEVRLPGGESGTEEDAVDTDHELPRSLAANPSLDRWIQIDAAETVTVYTGKVEYGQGIQTAIAQIAAEALGITLERVRVVMADTARTPDEGLTVGSMSLETSGRAVRWAAGVARRHLLALAFEELEAACAAPGALRVMDGTITDPVSGRTTTYWTLMGGRRFGLQLGGLAPRPAAGDSQELSGAVGRSAQRLDLPAKITGEPIFVHDLDLPDMVHARVVRPPRPGARLRSFNRAPVERMDGVLKIVRDGSFLGVIAEREEQALAAAERLRSESAWEGPPLSAPDYDALFSQPAHSFPIIEGAGVREPVPAISTPPEAVQTLRATYSRPYQMHASLGPSAAVALFNAGRMTLWLHSQGVFPQRANIAHVLGMDEADLHVIYRDGPGCYGHNGADDA
ncbi:MAG: 2Fe-2S iron-sulfur cluster-binding protein, partial [Candidatus Promineifilaceae bacterium]|nr:2Fe-2S iron-sulfur cluster-binding protein [Candidatus Promineifilaceae bacterium]